MAQDNTPAIVMYKGPQEDGYSIPFDKGFYGEVKVAFVRRGLTDYEYNPTTYSVDGELYAWEYEEEQGAEKVKKYYYTKSNTDKVFGSNNKQVQGVTLVSIAGAVAKFSDGKEGIRTRKKDIFFHSLLDWTGEPLGDDDWICIVRETVKKQPYSYPNNQKHIEGALDNLSRQIQELKAQSDVSLKVDPTFVQDPQKMNPIDWLNTIVRSTDTTARGLRYRNFWLEYSTDDPNKAEIDKSWTKLLNTTNITSVREWYDEDNNVYIPQYSMDGGLTWKALGAVHLIEDIQEQIDEIKENTYTKTEIDNKVTVINTAIDANADAIQATREDYIQADSEIHQILNSHADELTTLRGNQASLGDQVSGIEEKIPGTASAENPLVTRSEISSVYKFKGSVATYNDLPTGATVGDVYNVADTGANYAWDGSAWDKLSETVDLSSYATTAYVNAREQDIRADMNAKDSELETILNDHTERLNTLRTDHDDLGDDVSEIQAKIPESASDSNPLVTKQQLLEEEMDIREDLNGGLSELQTQVTAQAAEIAGKQDQLIAGDNITIVDNVISATGGGGGGGITNVVHDTTLTGSGTTESPLGLAETIKDEIASKAPTATVDALTTIVNDILTTYLKKTGDTMTGALNVPEFTVSTAEGSLSISVVAGVPVIASNNGMDIASRVKFDYTPTTDDNTTYANALEVSLMRKAQVAAAISDAMANVDALPDQTSNAGKVLTTDGSEASWTDMPGLIIRRL